MHSVCNIKPSGCPVFYFYIFFDFIFISWHLILTQIMFRNYVKRCIQCFEESLHKSWALIVVHLVWCLWRMAFIFFSLLVILLSGQISALDLDFHLTLCSQQTVYYDLGQISRYHENLKKIQNIKKKYQKNNIFSCQN